MKFGHRFLVIFLLASLGNASIYAQSMLNESDVISNQYKDFQENAAGLKISKIEIEKPKRTQLSLIRSLVQVREGETYTKTLHGEIYLRLWNPNIFKEIHITPIVNNDNTVTLEIKLVDKWTLIPVPILDFTDSSYYVGVAIVDTNLLGFGKTVVLVGAYGSDKYNFVLVYGDPMVFSSPFSLSFSNALSVSQYDDTSYGTSKLYISENDKLNNVIRKSEGLYFSSSVRVGYQFPYNLSPYIGARVYVYDDKVKKSEDYVPTKNAIERAWGFPLTLGLEYKNKKPYGIMQKGINSRIEYSNSFINSTNVAPFQIFKFNTEYEIGLDAKAINLLTLEFDTTWADSPLILSPTIGGSSKTRSISKSSIRSREYISSAISHSIKVWERPWGGMIVLYGGDLTWYKLADYDLIGERLINGGIFTGFGLVIKSLGIPVAKINFGYNIPAKYFSFSFSTGGP